MGGLPPGTRDIPVPFGLAGKLRGQIGERIARDLVRQHVAETARRAGSGRNDHVAFYCKTRGLQPKTVGDILVKPIPFIVSFLRAERKRLSKGKTAFQRQSTKLIANLQEILGHEFTSFNAQGHPDFLAIHYRRDGDRFVQVPVSAQIFEVKTNAAILSSGQELARAISHDCDIEYHLLRFHIKFDLPRTILLETNSDFELLAVPKKPRKVRRATLSRVQL